MSTETAMSDMIQVVTFTITDRLTKKGNYAIPIDNVKEIKIVDTITKIPKSKSYVKGIMNLRGKIIPIIDVNDKIGASSSTNIDSSKQRILVADVNDTLTGLLVDEVNEVMRFPLKEIEPVPTGAFENDNYIRGIVNVKDKIIILLDIAKFLENSTEAIKEAMSTTTEPTSESSTEPTSESSTEPTSESQSTENDEGLLPEIDEVIKQETQN